MTSNVASATISIHSLHTEGDQMTCRQRHPLRHFNPLPPHGGRPVMLASFGFLKPNFNPLPPHGGRPEVSYTSVQESIISIHSLHTEGDETHLPHPSAKLLFQSTPSTRRETMRGVPSVLTDVISIHSLHTEGDIRRSIFCLHIKTFQSTPSTRRETVESEVE